MYVVGGFDGKNYLDTIESLDLNAEESAWSIFTVAGFKGRYNAMVCALYENDPLLLVSGGFSGTYLSDAIVLNLQSKASRVFVAQSDLGFTCYD